MGNFNDRGGNRGGGRDGGFRGGDRGGRPSFNKGGFGGGRGGDRREISMHKAVCDECHKPCEVPFRPSSDKPIYCNDCFSGKKGNDTGRKDFGDRGGRRDFGGKPSFVRNDSHGGNDDVKKQLSEMNIKLDRLINAIEGMTSKKEIAKVTVSKPTEKVSVKKVALKAPVKKVEVKKVASKKKSK
ncbi:TPA: CxxC-x17-CxxC domain-containing protein [Candidatus Nomurabacteria bacterium]|nr:MAG: hypothetical protein O210_OD1C00001G0356 [Parcubacteria bacterium RAAC4_OD1_1]HCY26407.1 CxxC-x17-CxxC domain-containing protein [Candidatus Nomurabacteria bacterium]